MRLDVLMLVLVALALLPGCGGSHQIRGTSQPMSEQSPDTTFPETFTATRTFYGECVIKLPGEEKTAVLLAAPLIGAAIDKGFDLAANWLKEAGKANSFKATAFRDELVNMNEMPPCLQIIRGRFRRNMPPSETASDYLIGLAPEEEGRLPSGLDIYLAGKPDFFVEARLLIVRADGNIANLSSGSKSSSQDSGSEPKSKPMALVLAPSFLEYNRLVEDGSSTFVFRPRGLSLSIAFVPPGKSPESNEGGFGSLVPLGDFDVGTYERYPLADNIRQFLAYSPFIPLPEGAAAAPSSKQTAPDKPSETKPTTSQNPSVIKPFTIYATLHETRYENEFYTALAGFIDATKGDLKKAAMDEITADRAALNFQKFQTKQNDKADYYGKVADAEIARLEYCASRTDDIQAGKVERLRTSKAYYASQIAANVAALKIGEDLPYPTLVSVGSGRPLGCPAS